MKITTIAVLALLGKIEHSQALQLMNATAIEDSVLHKNSNPDKRNATRQADTRDIDWYAPNTPISDGIIAGFKAATRTGNGTRTDKVTPRMNITADVQAPASVPVDE